MLNLTLKPPALLQNSQSPSWVYVSARLPPHLLMGKFRKEKGATEPLYDQVLPLLPEGRAFFLLLFRASEAANFSPSLFKEATTGPRSLGSTEGVEPGGSGACVTPHAQEASWWERERKGR